MEALLAGELASSETLLDLVTGKPVATNKVLQQDEMNAAAALSHASNWYKKILYRQSTTVITYMNDVSPRVFRQHVNSTMTAAIALASTLPSPAREEELTKLRRIKLQPKPFYGPSKEGKTVRVTALGQSIPRLRNEIKASILMGWTTFDLRNAQLAIVAVDWSIPSLKTWLEDPKNQTWNAIASVLPRLSFNQAKPVLKEIVYALVYGATLKRVRSILVEHLQLTSQEIQVLLDHWILKELRIARRQQFKSALTRASITDCFGGKHLCRNKQEARSSLAQCSQARELQLLLPVFSLAAKSKSDFRIVLWEHDGFTVDLRRRSEATKDRICKIINSECRRLGYPTWLEEKS